MLYEFQSGFRNGLSTNTAMMTVVHDWAKAIENDEATTLVLLDFKKAFDLVSHFKLLNKLKNKFQFSSRACKLIQSYLDNRTQRVCIGDSVSELAPVTSGTPQGGILSALLFSLFINDLPEAVDVNVHLYADDSQLYCSAPRKDLNVCVKRMNSALVNVEHWANANEVQINPKKSKALIIDRKTHLNAPKIYFNNDVIEFVTRTKILGLSVNDHLTWDDHVNKICGEIYGCLGMLRKSQFFTSRELKLKLIRALIVPKLLYCSNIYLGCSRELWRKLNVAFNACARYIFNIHKFDSISQQANEILKCPLEDFLKFRMCLFIFYLLRKMTPNYLYDKLIFPRFPRGKLLKLPPSLKTVQFTTSFFSLGPHLWNDLDSKVRQIESAVTFKAECLSRFAHHRT